MKKDQVLSDCCKAELEEVHGHSNCCGDFDTQFCSKCGEEV